MRCLFLLAAVCFPLSLAHAGTVTVRVDAREDIYRAGGNDVRFDDGQIPLGIQVHGGESLSFAVTGKVSMDIGTGDFYNDADGTGAIVSQSSNFGAAGIAGLIAPGAGYLTGVFVGAEVPSRPAPQPLNFLQPGGTSFTDLSPQLNQVFFIGDGLTGDGTGAVQSFHAPPGALVLYLGISDAGGYNGPPGFYHDNTGMFQVTVTSSNRAETVPEDVPQTVPPGQIVTIPGDNTAPWMIWAGGGVAVVVVALLAILSWITLLPRAVARFGGWRRRAAAAGGNGDGERLVCRLVYELTVIQQAATGQEQTDGRIPQMIHRLSAWGAMGLSGPEIMARLEGYTAEDKMLGELLAQALAGTKRAL